MQALDEEGGAAGRRETDMSKTDQQNSLDKIDEQLKQKADELSATLDMVEQDVADYDEQMDHVKIAEETMIPLAKAEE